MYGIPYIGRLCFPDFLKYLPLLPLDGKKQNILKNVWTWIARQWHCGITCEGILRVVTESIPQQLEMSWSLDLSFFKHCVPRNIWNDHADASDESMVRRWTMTVNDVWLTSWKLELLAASLALLASIDPAGFISSIFGVGPVLIDTWSSHCHGA